MSSPFAVLRTLEGYEVIAADTGHPVCLPRDTPQSANGVCQVLNQAARRGPRELARALGATEDED